jgi:hypothetical protein
MSSSLDYPILQALPPVFPTAMQFDADCEAEPENPLRVWLCLFLCFIIVVLLSANATVVATVPITRAAAAKIALIVKIVVLFKLMLSKLSLYIILMTFFVEISLYKNLV